LGFGAPAAAQVVVTLRATGAAAPAANVSASAAADGSWAVLLPPQPSGAESGGAPTAYTIRAAVGGEAALIDDVLFGEVWLCGGQSNMQFSVGNASNATCAFTPPHSRPPAAA
jgi:sialate O-acetylesterase